MRPTTPNLKIPRSVGPSSPPQTPTTTSPVLGPRNGSKTWAMPPTNPHLHPMAPVFTARTVGKGPNFSHIRPGRPDQLSPRSSSASMLSSSSESDDDAPPSPSRSLSPEPQPAPPPPRARTGRTVVNLALEIEELSDFGDSDDERLGVVRPHAIEDAESERSRSRSRHRPEIYQRIIPGIVNLNCSDDSSDVSDFDEAEHQEFLRRQREAKRRRRMTSGSIGKRTISESIGSDTDREDLMPFLPPDEPGSSARRLRRRIGNRHSLQFQDPPPGIQELDEPESSEDEILISEALARELPYYEYVSMEVDSP